MADDPASPHGLAALAVSASAQELCIDCPPEVECETPRIVKQIRPEEPVAVADASIAAAPGQA